MTLQFLPASWELLAKLDIDATTLAAVPPAQLSAYIAAVCYLTDCIEESNPSIPAQIENFVQACHHFCNIAAWAQAWKVLTVPLLRADASTLADQLELNRLGREQVALYSRLSGKLDAMGNALCLRGLGQGYYNADDSDHGQQARICLQAALAAFRALEANAHIGWTLQILGVIDLYLLDNQAEAQTYFTQAIVVFRQMGDDRGLAHTLHNLAEIFNQQGRYEEAGPLYQEGLTLLYERLPNADRTERAWAHLAYGLFLVGQGELRNAQQQLRRSVRIFRELDQHSGVCWSLIQLVRLLVQQQRAGLARIVLQQLTTQYCNMAEVTHASAFVHHVAGWYGLLQQEYASALRSFQAMLAIAQKLDNRVETAYALEGLAFVTFYTQQVATSVRLWSAVDAIRQRAHVVVPPANRQRNDAALATLQSHLGTANFAHAWRVGQAMEIEEAVQIALGIC